MGIIVIIPRYLLPAMSQLNRRRLLLSGLSAGLAVPAIAQTVQAQTPTPNRPTLSLPQIEGLETIFGSDGTRSPQSVVRFSPTVPYNRAMSLRLIGCSQLGIAQFERGEKEPNFDGNIRNLANYPAELNRYTQVASFTAVLDATTTLFTNLGELGERIARRILRPRQVFLGFALTSPTDNIIVFRGTMNPKEWIANFQARQSDYPRSRQIQGRVHTGFLRLYQQLAGQVRQVADQLNPNLPCYVAGHSLGGALATLAVADLVTNYANLANQLYLYTYASPRVGNEAFATSMRDAVPNSYRVLNFSDVVPMVPPMELSRDRYTHIGQDWMFLNYAGGGDVSDSHAVPIYAEAIARQLETNQMPNFPVACR